MKRIAAWIGVIATGLLGTVACFATLYLFAPIAPSFWLLILVPILVGAALAGWLARYLARPAKVGRGTVTVVGATLAALPLTGLVVAMMLSPPEPQLAKLNPDPRGAATRVAVSTGSTLGTWTRRPERPSHTTPVIFLHGGPGSYIRNRDFAITRGLRDQGFTTIFYDQAGSGASSDIAVADYTVPRAVADLDALREKLGADKLILWGQSWGASLAMAYVRAHPDRVAALLLDSPGDYPGAPQTLDYAKTDLDHGFQPTLRQATFYLLLNHAPQLAEAWQSQSVAHRTRDASGSQTKVLKGYQCKGDRNILRREVSAGGGGFYANQLLQNSLNTMPRDVTVAFRGPSVIVHPECDYVPISPDYRRALPNLERIDVPGRGHAFFGHDAQLSAIMGRYANARLSAVP